MSMGDRIKERRKAMHLTQDEFGEKLGVQKSAVAKWENGRVTNIKRSVIQRMAQVLDCSPVYLLGFEDEEEEEQKLTEMQQEFLSMLDAMPEAKQKALYDFMKTLLE